LNKRKPDSWAPVLPGRKEQRGRLEKQVPSALGSDMGGVKEKSKRGGPTSGSHEEKKKSRKKGQCRSGGNWHA